MTKAVGGGVPNQCLKAVEAPKPDDEAVEPGVQNKRLKALQSGVLNECLLPSVQPFRATIETRKPDAETQLAEGLEPVPGADEAQSKPINEQEDEELADAEPNEDDNAYAPQYQPAPLPSPEAIAQRVRRLTKPRADGTMPLPPVFMDQWKNIKGGGRASVLHLFEKCNFEIDRAFCGACLVVEP